MTSARLERPETFHVLHDCFVFISKSDKINTVSEPINKLCVPLASSAGKTLQDMWELVFGPLGTFVEKKRIIRQKNLEDFKKSLKNKIATIPEEL